MAATVLALQLKPPSMMVWTIRPQGITRMKTVKNFAVRLSFLAFFGLTSFIAKASITPKINCNTIPVSEREIQYRTTTSEVVKAIETTEDTIWSDDFALKFRIATTYTFDPIRDDSYSPVTIQQDLEPIGSAYATSPQAQALLNETDASRFFPTQRNIRMLLPGSFEKGQAGLEITQINSQTFRWELKKRTSYKKFYKVTTRYAVQLESDFYRKFVLNDKTYTPIVNHQMTSERIDYNIDEIQSVQVNSSTTRRGLVIKVNSGTRKSTVWESYNKHLELVIPQIENFDDLQVKMSSLTDFSVILFNAEELKVMTLNLKIGDNEITEAFRTKPVPIARLRLSERLKLFAIIKNTYKVP